MATKKDIEAFKKSPAYKVGHAKRMKEKERVKSSLAKKKKEFMSRPIVK